MSERSGNFYLVRPHRAFGSVIAHLADRRWPAVATILAVGLTLPSLWGGLEADDYILKISLLGSAYIPDLKCAPWDAFVFADGDVERLAEGRDIGVVPWWTIDELKLAFFRPLSSLTHWLDFRLWPDSPAIMHAQNILWYGGLVAAVAVFYRRIMGSAWAAGLAALLFALDEAHATAAGWISGRNGLISTLFGVLTLMAYDRWRRGAWGLGGVGVPLLLGVCLFSAEAGTGALAFIAAYALFLDHGSWLSRLKGLLPCIAVVLLWGMLRTTLGYGAHGSEAYVDPITEPLSYARVLLDCGPMLLLGQWALIPLDLYPIYDLFMPGLARIAWLGAIGFMSLVAFMLIPMLRCSKTARFWACGMSLAVAPLCATSFPMDRILFFVGLGAAPLLAQFLAEVFGRTPWRETHARVYRRLPAKTLACFFVLIHVVAAAVILPLRAAKPFGPEYLLDRVQVNTPLDAGVESQDVIVVNAPGAGLIGMMPILRELAGLPVPRRVRVLGPSMEALELRRPDAHTLVVRPAGGYFSLASDMLFRARRYPLRLGEEVVLTGMTIEIIALNELGFPEEVSFRFSVPLEDGSLRWLHWIEGSFVPFTPPAIGETLRLAAPVPEVF